MKARYVAGMLDGTLQLSVSPDNQVRARLITTTRGVYDALSAVLGGDEFKRVVISKRVTLSTGADGSAKVNKKTTYTIDLDDEQTHTALTLAAAKSVLVKHAAQAALDGDIPLLQAAIKRLEAPARPRKPSDTVASAAAPIEVDRSMLTPAWLCGYVDSVGTSEIRRGRAAVKVSFPSTPSGQELQKAFAHAFQTPDHEGDMCTSQQHTVVFSGDLHPAHALNVLGGSLSIMRKAFEEAATPPAPKPRAPRLPKKRPVADENTDPNVGASSGPKKQKVGDAVGAPLGSDTPPPPPPASQTQLEADAGTSSS